MKTNPSKIIATVIAAVAFFSCKTQQEITVEYLLENYDLYELEELLEYKLDNSEFKDPKYSKNIRRMGTQSELNRVKFAIKAIRDNDNRKDIYQETDTNKIKNAFGVAVMVSKFNLGDTTTSGKVKLLNIERFRDKENLCAKESFGCQPTIGKCSAFAISENYIVTAGHCFKSKNPNTFRFIFDFKAIGEYNTPTEIDTCLIYAVKEKPVARLDCGDYDFAIYETYKKIPKKRILCLNTEERTCDSANLYIIGHPNGLPLKIADDAQVMNNTNALYFTANLDAYKGNSGSPVFNTKTHKVEGIFVRDSMPHFRSIQRLRCYASVRCLSCRDCENQHISRVSQFKQHLKKYSCPKSEPELSE